MSVEKGLVFDPKTKVTIPFCSSVSNPAIPMEEMKLGTRVSGREKKYGKRIHNI